MFISETANAEACFRILCVQTSHFAVSAKNGSINCDASLVISIERANGQNFHKLVNDANAFVAKLRYRAN